MSCQVLSSSSPNLCSCIFRKTCFIFFAKITTALGRFLTLSREGRFTIKLPETICPQTTKVVLLVKKNYRYPKLYYLNLFVPNAAKEFSKYLMSVRHNISLVWRLILVTCMSIALKGKTVRG